MTPLTLSVHDAAELLGVSDDLVYRLCDEQLLPVIQLGRRRVIPRAAIDQLIDHYMTGWSPADAAARIASVA